MSRLSELPSDPRDAHSQPDRKPAPAPRYVDCPVCGQRVDRKSVAQTRYHNDEPHEPQIYL